MKYYNLSIWIDLPQEEFSNFLDVKIQVGDPDEEAFIYESGMRLTTIMSGQFV